MPCTSSSVHMASGDGTSAVSGACGAMSLVAPTATAEASSSKSAGASLATGKQVGPRHLRLKCAAVPLAISAPGRRSWQQTSIERYETAGCPLGLSTCSRRSFAAMGPVPRLSRARPRLRHRRRHERGRMDRRGRRFLGAGRETNGRLAVWDSPRSKAPSLDQFLRMQITSPVTAVPGVCFARGAPSTRAISNNTVDRCAGPW